MHQIDDVDSGIGTPSNEEHRAKMLAEGQDPGWNGNKGVMSLWNRMPPHGGLAMLDAEPCCSVAEATLGPDCHLIQQKAWSTGPGRPGQHLHLDFLPLFVPQHFKPRRVRCLHLGNRGRVPAPLGVERGLVIGTLLHCCLGRFQLLLLRRFERGRMLLLQFIPCIRFLIQSRRVRVALCRQIAFRLLAVARVLLSLLLQSRRVLRVEL